MRKHRVLVMLLTLCLCFGMLAVTAGAATVTASGNCGSDLKWELTDDGTLTISGTGNMTNYMAGMTPWINYENKITSVVIQSGVTSVGNNAFNECSNLVSVTLPEGLVSIGNSAFDGCLALSGINIPSSVTSIGASAFKLTGLQKVVIPKGVTEIKSDTFDTCRSLTNVTLPEGLVSIGDYAFLYCNNLQQIVIPSTVESIGTCAFCLCTNLNDVTVPDSVTKIASSAFLDSNKVTFLCHKGSYAQTFAAKNGISYCMAPAGKTLGHTFTDNSCTRCGKVGVEITSQPVTLGMNYLSGETVRFATKANGSGLSYQWQYRTSSTGSWKSCSSEGNKTATLTLSATAARHNFQFRCKITDQYGNTAYTNVAKLYVLGIKTQPATQKVEAGQTATFTVKTTGLNRSYQWQYRTSSSGSWKNSGATGNQTATLKVKGTTARNGYQYRCVLTDADGQKLESKAVTLYVLGVKTQPADQTLKAGTTATFSVKATGAGKTYQWQYRTSTTGSWKNSTSSGNKTATLTLKATTGRDGYQFRCVVMDNAGNQVESNAATLRVLGIKTQPAGKTVEAGSYAKFNIKATGEGLTYQWQYRTSSTGSWKISGASGCKTSALSVKATAERNGYQYRCKVVDAAGNVVYSSAATLKVQ